jgi:hypothetical protein
MDSERQLPLRQLSAIAVEAKYANEEVVMLGFKKPSVTFYTHERINYIKFSQEVLEHIRQESVQPVKSPSLLVLAEQAKFREMELSPDDYKSIASRGAYHLIRVPLKPKKKTNIS